MNRKIKLHSKNDKMNGCPYKKNLLDIGSSSKNSKANKELFFISDIDMLEMDMEKVACVIDKKIIESEENALAFLCNNPERIPRYIKILKAHFENWENDSR